MYATFKNKNLYITYPFEACDNVFTAIVYIYECIVAFLQFSSFVNCHYYNKTFIIVMLLYKKEKRSIITSNF